MCDVKLYYFDIRGRGETSRLVMHAAGQKFDDCRVTDWPATKAETPYGQLPYMVYKGKKYGQSNAIAAFLAREYGLYGKTNLESLRIDEVVNLVGDFIGAMVKAKFEKDEQRKKENEAKLQNEDTPRFLSTFEKLLAENGSNGFFVGNSITLADLEVFNITDSLVNAHDQAVAQYPNLIKMRAAVAGNPNIKAYLATRKVTPM